MGGGTLLIFLAVTGVLVVIHHRNQSLLLFQGNFSLLNLEFLNCRFPPPNLVTDFEFCQVVL